MEPEATEQFPDTFDRIELGAVGRQEEQDEVPALSPSPVQVKFGVMVLCVIDDDDDIAPATAQNILPPPSMCDQ